MQLRIGIVMWSIVIACAGAAGCATGGNSGGYSSFMQKCMDNAKTEQDRSECAWKNSERMAGGN